MKTEKMWVSCKNRRFKNNQKFKNAITHGILIMGSFLMLFPMIWLVSGVFKPGSEIFSGEFQLISENFTLKNFADGWYINPNHSFGYFLKNTFVMVGVVIGGTVISSSLAGFAFARLNFIGKWPLFIFMLATMMLPSQVTLIPKYIMFSKIGWIDSYLPFSIPAFCAVNGFHVFLMVQFIRGIPKELDEAAYMDGCSTFGIYGRIIMPLCKPVLFSVAIFTFIWTWDDYLNQLIYISSVDKFTVSLFLRSLIDSTSSISWGPLLANTLVSLIPGIVLFFIAQPYFVEGIATSGLKG